MKLAEIIQEYKRRASPLGLQVDVLADGSPDASIAIIAEAPGLREVELRTPLVGPSGKTFSAGRKNVYELGWFRRNPTDDRCPSRQLPQ